MSLNKLPNFEYALAQKQLGISKQNFTCRYYIEIKS